MIKKRLLVLIFIMLNIIISCVEHNPEIDIILSKIIDTTDLPSGWKYCCSYIKEIPGAKSRWRGYYGPAGDKEPWIAVNQQLILYPETVDAEFSFPTLEQKHIPTSVWYLPEELVSLELEYSQETEIACMEARVNGQFHYACTAITRYDRMISVIYANIFPDGPFTFDDFKYLLTSTDKKLSSYLISDPTEFEN